MSKAYYECHITFEGDDIVGEAVCFKNKWTYSRIDGDPIMGEGVRQYATKHFNVNKRTQASIWEEMQKIRKTFESEGLIVTRCKIELVVQDERYGSSRPVP